MRDATNVVSLQNSDQKSLVRQALKNQKRNAKIGFGAADESLERLMRRTHLGRGTGDSGSLNPMSRG